MKQKKNSILKYKKHSLFLAKCPIRNDSAAIIESSRWFDDINSMSMSTRLNLIRTNLNLDILHFLADLINKERTTSQYFYYVKTDM